MQFIRDWRYHRQYNAGASTHIWCPRSTVLSFLFFFLVPDGFMEQICLRVGVKKTLRCEHLRKWSLLKVTCSFSNNTSQTYFNVWSLKILKSNKTMSCQNLGSEKIPSELDHRSKEIQLIRDTICTCICMFVLYHVPTDARCTARKRERKRGAIVRRGMEKPIPSYQRKWLLADRKEHVVRSPQKTIIINVYDRASSKLERLFTIGP